jgi:hypothetical protein
MNKESQKVNVQELMKQVDASIAASKVFDYKGLADGVTKATFNFFADLRDRGVITSFAVSDAKVVRHTWTTLYPNLLKRLLAWIAYDLGLGDETTPRWYHRVLPYTVIKAIVVNQEYFDTDTPKEEVYWYINEIYEATIKYPHETICQDIAVAPVTPIERICITLKA